MKQTNVTAKQHRYYIVGIIFGICRGLGVPKEKYNQVKPILHKEIKKCFEIDSMKNVSVAEFEKIAGAIRMIFCREFAYMLNEADEEEVDPNTMSMRDFLAYKKIN